MDIYILKLEDNDYLILNGSDKESELFSSTGELDEATLFNKETILKMKKVISSYTGYLYISEKKEYKKVISIEKYKMKFIGKEDL